MNKSIRIALVVTILFSTSLLAQSAQTQTNPDTSELLRLEQVWNDAHLKGDADSLEALWANDITVTVPKMQVMLKPQLIAFARSGRMKFQKYETSDLQARVYGDTAVVTGRLLRTRTLGDQQVNDDWRFTKVYVRQSGKWQVVSWQASESPSQ